MARAVVPSTAAAVDHADTELIGHDGKLGDTGFLCGGIIWSSLLLKPQISIRDWARCATEYQRNGSCLTSLSIGFIPYWGTYLWWMGGYTT